MRATVATVILVSSLILLLPSLQDNKVSAADCTMHCLLCGYEETCYEGGCAVGCTCTDGKAECSYGYYDICLGRYRRFVYHC